MNLESLEQKAYINQFKRHKRIILFWRFFLIVLFVIIWELAANLKWIDSFFFSSPSRIAKTFLSMCKDYSIFIHTGITVGETLVSFLLVTLLSLLFAMLLWYSNSTAQILEPYLVILNSLPKSALAPLLIVWLGTGSKTIIIAGISVAIFGSIISLYTSFLNVDAEKNKLIYTLGGSKFDVLKKIIVPATIPVIISNMKVNIGLSLVGVIIGEFLAARRGLGYLIIYSSQVFQLDRLILSILILCFIAFILYEALQQLEKKFVYK